MTSTIWMDKQNGNISLVLGVLDLGNLVDSRSDSKQDEIAVCALLHENITSSCRSGRNPDDAF